MMGIGDWGLGIGDYWGFGRGKGTRDVGEEGLHEYT